MSAGLSQSSGNTHEAREESAGSFWIGELPACPRVIPQSFVDGAPASFPQMDVWARCYSVGNAFDRRQFRTEASETSGVSYPAKSGEISVFP
jgi:hypothetical protein